MLTAIPSAAGAGVLPRDDIIPEPRPDRFSVCHGHGCRKLAVVGLDNGDWVRIRNLFANVAGPAEERGRLKRAIGMIEHRAGAATGTSLDVGGTFAGLGKRGQMDCIDESVNTMTYLRMLAGDGLMRWHTVEDRAARGWFVFGWPHSTAVIRDRVTGRLFAVDSWFHDNGVAPEIVPLARWKSGWRPR